MTSKKPRSHPKEDVSITERQLIDLAFGHGTRKLNDDYMNAFAYMSVYATSSALFEKITPIPTYQDYFDQNSSEFDYIMEKSDPEAVEKLNELIIQFNENLSHIKETKDKGAIVVFLVKVKLLLRALR